MRPDITRPGLAPVLALTLAAAPALAQDKPELTVYTYDSFVSDWGPGPAIEEGFEAECGCDLTFVGAGDGAALLGRLKLEGTRSRADVVLGLDTNLTAEAREAGLVVPHGIELPELSLPIDWNDTDFVPYDWGYFAFVHQADFAAPADFRALAESDTSIVIQDPRTSTPGLGLLLWVQAAYGDEAPALWAELSDNIVTVTKGWSEAYGLFLEGEADMVLSYTTSPAYHRIAEEDDSKSAARFAEGHYLQVEVAALTSHSRQHELGRDFLRYLVSDAAQSVLPTTNWMYPAVLPQAGLPEGFPATDAVDKALLLPEAEVPAIRAEAIEAWRNALSQ